MKQAEPVIHIRFVSYSDYWHLFDGSESIAAFSFPVVLFPPLAVFSFEADNVSTCFCDEWTLTASLSSAGPQWVLSEDTRQNGHHGERHQWHRPPRSRHHDGARHQICDGQCLHRRGGRQAKGLKSCSLISHDGYCTCLTSFSSTCKHAVQIFSLCEFNSAPRFRPASAQLWSVGLVSPLRSPTWSWSWPTDVPRTAWRRWRPRPGRRASRSTPWAWPGPTWPRWGPWRRRRSKTTSSWWSPSISSTSSDCSSRTSSVVRRQREGNDIVVYKDTVSLTFDSLMTLFSSVRTGSLKRGRLPGTVNVKKNITCCNKDQTALGSCSTQTCIVSGFMTLFPVREKTKWVKWAEFFIEKEIL